MPESTELGRIRLYKFNNPDGLEQMGQMYYLPTEASGKPEQEPPGLMVTEKLSRDAERAKPTS